MIPCAVKHHPLPGLRFACRAGVGRRTSMPLLSRRARAVRRERVPSLRHEDPMNCDLQTEPLADGRYRHRCRRAGCGRVVETGGPRHRCVCQSAPTSAEAETNVPAGGPQPVPVQKISAPSLVGKVRLFSRRKPAGLPRGVRSGVPSGSRRSLRCARAATSSGAASRSRKGPAGCAAADCGAKGDSSTRSRWQPRVARRRRRCGVRKWQYQV